MQEHIEQAAIKIIHEGYTKYIDIIDTMALRTIGPGEAQALHRSREGGASKA